jgi:hypothetical protein
MPRMLAANWNPSRARPEVAASIAATITAAHRKPLRGKRTASTKSATAAEMLQARWSGCWSIAAPKMP